MLLCEFILNENLSASPRFYRALPFSEFAQENRRFIFDPVSRRMLIGGLLPKGKSLVGSHSEDWYDVTGSNKFFDRCVRGWIGMGGRSYKNGIIHFAPPVNPYADGAYSCISYFVKNGASEKCLLRGAPGMNEEPLGKVYPELFNKS